MYSFNLNISAKMSHGVLERDIVLLQNCMLMILIACFITFLCNKNGALFALVPPCISPLPRKILFSLLLLLFYFYFGQNHSQANGDSAQRLSVLLGHLLGLIRQTGVTRNSSNLSLHPVLNRAQVTNGTSRRSCE